MTFTVLVRGTDGEIANAGSYPDFVQVRVADTNEIKTAVVANEFFSKTSPNFLGGQSLLFERSKYYVLSITPDETENSCLVMMQEVE